MVWGEEERLERDLGAKGSKTEGLAEEGGGRGNQKGDAQVPFGVGGPK